MLCAFLGALPISVFMNMGEGKGALYVSLAADLIYSVLLFLLRLPQGNGAIFTPQYFKNVICAGAGILFGCAICIFRKPKGRYYKKR